jgi:inosine-uridine nucleoside N-ribohydrolase
VTPYAEFNAYMDPEAAEEVVWSGRPCDFVPLDATENRLFRAPELTAGPGGSRGARLVADLIDYLRRSHVRLGSGDGVFMHDVIAAAVWLGLIDVEWVEARLDRVESEGERRGMVVIDGPDAPACRYARRVDEEVFLDLWRRVAGSL